MLNEPVGSLKNDLRYIKYSDACKNTGDDLGTGVPRTIARTLGYKVIFDSCGNIFVCRSACRVDVESFTERDSLEFGPEGDDLFERSRGSSRS